MSTVVRMKTRQHTRCGRARGRGRGLGLRVDGNIVAFGENLPAADGTPSGVECDVHNVGKSQVCKSRTDGLIWDEIEFGQGVDSQRRNAGPSIERSRMKLPRGLWPCGRVAARDEEEEHGEREGRSRARAQEREPQEMALEWWGRGRDGEMEC